MSDPSKENASFKERLTPENRQKMQNQIADLGSLLHDEWRLTRKLEDGTFDPRVETTKDEDWILAHGTDQVDIANNFYSDLPIDWQGENKASAEVVVGEVWRAAAEGHQLDESFIEETSLIIHDKWLERNGSLASEEQKKPYVELSEEEKEKDRAIVRKAIEMYKTRC